MRRGIVLASIVGAFVVLAALPSTAGAVLMRLPDGHTVSYQPLAGTMKQPKSFDGFFSNLDYNGGPVMPSNTDYLIFWKPASYATDYPSDYKSGLSTYFTDLAHDSGGHQNVDSAATQYNDAAGNFANYSTTFGGSLNDTNPYPANDCGSGAGSPPVCFTGADLRAQIQSFLTANGLPHDVRHEYFVMLPPGVQNCFDTNPSDGCSLGTSAPFRYCAYHGASTTAPSPTAFIYSNDPYVTSSSGNNGCDIATDHPNGTSDGALIGGLSHEHNESITDPFPNTAWTDFTTGSSTGFENGDKCSASVQGFAGAFGPSLGTASDGSPYNQLINGHEYLYQQEWSNQGATCVQRFTFSGSKPSAQFTSTPGAGNAMNFAATASTAPGGVAQYHWQFENTISGSAETESSSPTTSHTYAASGSHTVSLTVYGADGTSIGASRVIATGVAGPTPAFSISPPQTIDGAAPTFASSSSAAGGDPIAQETWNFGDGTTGSGNSVSHSYSSAGTYPVTLMITTTLGQTASTTKQLVVTSPPVAAFNLAPSQVAAGAAVAFDGSGSGEPGGSIASYGWSFGDGSVGTGTTTSHVYTRGGSYTVTLTVTDSNGYTASASHAVSVAGVPTAVITAGATATGGQADSFSGAGSSDVGSSISSYHWSFGDGGAGTGQSVSYVYSHTGSFSVTLTVTDATGATASATTTVKVVSPTITSVSVKTGKSVEKLTLIVSGPGTLTVGKHKFKIKVAGTFVYKLKLSKAQRNRLRQHHSVKIKVTLKFQPTVGSSSTRTVSFKIKG